MIRVAWRLSCQPDACGLAGQEPVATAAAGNSLRSTTLSNKPIEILVLKPLYGLINAQPEHKVRVVVPCA